MIKNPLSQRLQTKKAIRIKLYDYIIVKLREQEYNKDKIESNQEDLFRKCQSK